MATRQRSITTLPYELLGEVFTHYASVCPDAPIILGAVSHLFRLVAYSTPSAWSYLKLSDGDGRSKTALWFAMSKACHVDVQIQMAEVRHGTTNNNTSVVEVPAALEALRSHTDRITSLCLRTGTQAHARAVLTAIYSDAVTDGTVLRSLRISAAAITPGPPPAFPAIPSITDLETTNVALRGLPSLDLARLQRLRIVQPIISAPLGADDILDLISAAPRLRRLKVDARIADAAAVAHETQFLPQLVELHLRANNIDALLDRFIVPALHVLHLSDLDGKRADASDDVGAALHRLLVRMELGNGDVKSNELRVFELVGVAVERGNAVWERCVQRMKAVEVFSVEEPCEKEGLVQDEVAAVAQTEEPQARPIIKAGFCFGFGAAESDFAARREGN
ncbi:hypothetical protein B0H17DRAFT_1339136 [Mycena rosella]|uniref:Uncharacterized protein n=1 Tax=Mycena rosella TaxID=1033263 RepID=A0AAD7C9Z1_MYCRO|nr:hypothetical protein B0H17DRAFT_1339136 [Mycena rosella]